MNPIVTIVNKFKTYQLEKRDLNKLKRVKLTFGQSDLDEILNHEMCIMQAVAMVTTQHEDDPKEAYEEGVSWTYTDHPICVSEQITHYLIEVNDSCAPSERAKLIKLVPAIVNTCPIRVKQLKTKVREERAKPPEYLAAEKRRGELLSQIPPDEAAPIKDKIKLVEEAADLYRVAPGLVEEL